MRVSRLITAPVKSLAVLNPQYVDLVDGRVVGDREFFLMDEDGSLVTCTKVGDLLKYRAEYDAETGVLDVHGPTGLLRSAATEICATAGRGTTSVVVVAAGAGRSSRTSRASGSTG